MSTPPGGPLEPGIVPNLKYDLPSGIVVFLVALPLCLGIALASDAPLMSGIIAGICGGIVVTTFSGSPLSVSGPAAGLATIVAAGIGDVGFSAFLTAVVIAGLLQIAAGLARAGFLAELFPLSVIKGMLAAIGIILILKQIPHALGYDKDFEGDLGFWAPGGEENTFTQIILAIQTMSPGVVLVTVIGLAILVVWEQPFIKNQSWSRLVPGPLLVVLMGVLMNELYAIAAPALYISSEAGHLVTLPSFDSFGDLRSQLATPDFTRAFDSDIWVLGATLAAVASIETLLCVEATDKLDPFKRITPTNRELVAQGMGNTVSGLIGGIPVTAVIVRSSANIQTGARTRASAFIHGVLLLSLVLAVPFLLNKIPLGSLAAILLVIGYKLARISLFQRMWTQGLDQFLPFIITIVATVFSDLLTGVGIGFVTGAIMVVMTNFHSAIRAEVDAEGVHRIVFDKDVSFLNKGKLRQALAAVPADGTVVIDGSKATFIDHDISEVVADFKATAAGRGLQVTLIGLDSEAHPINRAGRRKNGGGGDSGEQNAAK